MRDSVEGCSAGNIILGKFQSLDFSEYRATRDIASTPCRVGDPATTEDVPHSHTRDNFS